MAATARDGRIARQAETPGERDEKLLVRAAWLAYVGGLTQGQIAKSLGLNRIRVNRMLAQAREQGIVQIRINSKIAECVELENRLQSRFGLAEAIVVPTPPDAALIPQAVAAAAGAALSARMRDGISVGVGWGRTLQLSLKSISVRALRGVEIVSLLGGLSRGSAINIYEISSRLADLFAADCLYVAAPVFVDDEATRDVLLRQSILQEAFERAREVDIAFLSVGGLHRDATLFKIGMVSLDDLETLRAAGAVGDICGHWIDAHGELVDHPLNRRVIAMSPDHLRDIGTVIVPSGGADKAPGLLALLRRGAVDVLVTDESAASAVLAAAGPEDGAARQP